MNARFNGPRKHSIAFPALVTLTEILDTYLEWVFNIQEPLHIPPLIPKPDLADKIRAWENSLPVELTREMLQGDELRVPNLRLAYLYIKFLDVKEQPGIRMKLNEDRTYTNLTSLDPQQPALRAAGDIVRFVQNLDERDLSDFWLSPIAFTLSDTVSYLLGCARVGRRCDPPIGLTSSVSFRLARDMITALQSHQTRYEWDIGAACLAQHAKTVEQLLVQEASAAGETSDQKGE